MKTKITTLLLCLVVSLSSIAQQKTDGFFNHDNSRYTISEIPIEMNELSFNSMNISEQAPLGNGVFLLACIAIIYVVYKIREMKMKKIYLLLMLLSSLSFTQCKKAAPIDEDGQVEMIPVTFELSLNPDSKTYFGDLLPFGEINWGNDKAVEYIYLTIPSRYGYTNPDLPATVYIGSMFEMKADVSDYQDKLVFTGMLPSTNYLKNKQCCLYYFGNNGNGDDGTNVTNYYDPYMGRLVGKKISFAEQTGSLDKLGDFHIGKISVKVNRISDNVTGEYSHFELIGDTFETINSIAKLDLTDETTLGGTAAEIQSFTLLWNFDTQAFDEIIEVVPNATIDVSDNDGKNSYISLLPTRDKVYLECSKGRYEFTDGIVSNSLYIGRSADNIDDALPLHWE